MDYLYYGDSQCQCGCSTLRNGVAEYSNDGGVTVGLDVLGAFMRKIYGGFDARNEVEHTLWREVLRIINEGTVEGLLQAPTPPTHDDEFYRALRHSNEVFAAFKVHDMGVHMAQRLLDADGKLKPYRQWAEDVKDITTHHVGSWLKTEYDTAVLRAHAAADWREFERNKDVMPNLRWVKTTSPNPEGSHRQYWEKGLVLPVDDPFWDEHHPGDRWNCKCSLEQTDDPVTMPDDMEPTPPQRGLENNPGKDGHTFNDTHPYFPHDCSRCFANRGFKNKVHTLFTNQDKHCNACAKIDNVIGKANERVDVKKMFAELGNLSGAQYINQIRRLTELKIYTKVEKDIFSAISKDSAEYANLLAGARKATRYGYKVYILPNPKGVRSADYIYVRKGVYKLFDLKTITGTGSIGSRLEESIGQTNRVFLNLTTTYPANRMATEIKQYFEANDDALEVLVAVGKKMISVDRDQVLDRNFHKHFRKKIEQ